MASPLVNAKASVAELANEVELFRRDCADVLQKEDVGTTSDATRDLCLRCVRYQDQTEQLLNHVESLTVNGEPRKMADFAQRKRQELRRLQGLQDRLSNLSSQLELSDVHNVLSRELSDVSTDVALPSHLQGSTVDTTQGGSAVEVQYDEEDDQSQTGSEYELPQAEAMASYQAQQDGDLSFQEGEVIYVVDDTREDGWWRAENAQGVCGLVPSNYFEIIDNDSASDVGEPTGHREVGEDSLAEEQGLSELGTLTEATEAATESTATAEEQVKKDTTTGSPSSARWKKLKDVVTKPSTAQVLQAMGVVPPGFRRSMLADLQKQSVYTCRQCLEPKVDGTGVLLDGIRWDSQSDSLKPISVAVLRGVSVMSCRKIPMLSDTVTVLRRQVRVALFDKRNVSGNIVSAHATLVDKDPRSWKFSKIGSQSITDATFIFRAEKVTPSLCMLFELAMTCENNRTKEVTELSCGWATLDFMSATGTPIVNRSYDLKLNGGTPHESGVELDQVVAIDGRFSALKASLLQGANTPTITVKMNILGQDTIDMANALPKQMVVRNCHLQLLALYRQQQGLQLAAGRPPHAASPVCSRLFSLFPQAVDDCDIMDMLLIKFPEAVKSYKRDHRQRPPGYKRDVLCDIVEKELYVLLTSSGLPPVARGMLVKEQERRQYIQQFSQQADCVASLFTSAAHHRAFHTDETAFAIGRAALKRLP